MGIRVRCRGTAFVDGRRYPAGEVFELPEGYLPGENMEIVELYADSRVKRPPPREDLHPLARALAPARPAM
jgi:hypothetical protein